MTHHAILADVTTSLMPVAAVLPHAPPLIEGHEHGERMAKAVLLATALIGLLSILEVAV
jgi:hypothetical protein